MNWALNAIRKARKERANRSAFSALIAEPAVGSIALPANGRVGLVAVAGAEAGELAAILEGPSSRTIQTPAMVAGTILVIDRLERGTVVNAEEGFDVVLDVGLGVWTKIGEGA